jgi:hypothetical protein
VINILKNDGTSYTNIYYYDNLESYTSILPHHTPYTIQQCNSTSGDTNHYNPTLPCNSVRYYTNIPRTPQEPNQHLLVQVDGSANRSIINNQEHLVAFRSIPEYPIFGVEADRPITCTGQGYLPWTSSVGDVIYVAMLYCPKAPSEPVISPNDICLSHHPLSSGWVHFAPRKSGHGNLTLLHTEGTQHPIFKLEMHNGLWSHKAPLAHNSTNQQIPITTFAPSTHPTHAKVRRITHRALYELYHQQLGHCGQCILSIIHKHIKGIPKLKGNAFYICPSCALAQIAQCKLTTHTPSYDDNPNGHSLILPATNPDFLDLISSQHIDDIICGENFHLDFGFPVENTFKKMK